VAWTGVTRERKRGERGGCARGKLGDAGRGVSMSAMAILQQVTGAKRSISSSYSSLLIGFFIIPPHWLECKDRLPKNGRLVTAQRRLAQWHTRIVFALKQPLSEKMEIH
jgi:hypothetical protein